MKVSRSSYYEWLYSPATDKGQQDEELIKIMKPIFKEGRSTYGTRRIKKKLALQNKIVSRRRIGRLMAEAGLSCKTRGKFKATTDSKHTQLISPNLLER
jgi:putative transposase